MISELQTALRQRALYNKTKREIEAMPLDVALDLDINRQDAAKFAARAVYGTQRAPSVFGAISALRPAS